MSYYKKKIGVYIVDEIVNDFFIEDEKKFLIDDVMALIKRMSHFSKLVGRNGKVHILDKNLNGTEQLKLFLVTRFLGAELGLLKPELKINEKIKFVSIKDIAEFLSVNEPNARSRMSALVSEDFCKREDKGLIVVNSYQVEKFIGSLENGKNKEEEKSKKSASKSKNKTSVNKKVRKPTPSSKNSFNLEINEEELFSLLSSNLEIDSDLLKDFIFIREDNTFKFNNVKGNSKLSKQKKIILCAAYIFLLGYRKKTFSTRIMTDICFNSAIDSSGVQYTIRDLKKGGYISKSGVRSQENILLEKGKSEARKLFEEIKE